MDFGAVIKGVVAELCDLDPAAVSDQASFESLGIDSLDAAEVLVEVEMQLGCELPVDVLRRIDRATTIADVARELEAL